MCANENAVGFGRDTLAFSNAYSLHGIVILNRDEIR